jgi:hypothetical protein
MVRAKSADPNEWSANDANRNSERATTINGSERERDSVCFSRATNRDAANSNAARGISKSRAKSRVRDHRAHGF